VPAHQLEHSTAGTRHIAVCAVRHVHASLTEMEMSKTFCCRTVNDPNSSPFGGGVCSCSSSGRSLQRRSSRRHAEAASPRDTHRPGRLPYSHCCAAGWAAEPGQPRCDALLPE
jgi:hypothetical protein